MKINVKFWCLELEIDLYCSVLLEENYSLIKKCAFLSLFLSLKMAIIKKKGKKEDICSKVKWLFLSISSSLKHDKKYSKGLELNDFLDKCWKLVISSTRPTQFLSIFHSHIYFQYYCQMVLRKTYQISFLPHVTIYLLKVNCMEIKEIFPASLFTCFVDGSIPKMSVK